MPHPPPFAPKPKGPTAKSGYPLFAWMRCFPKGESKIERVVSGKNLVWPLPEKSDVAQTVMFRFLRRNPGEFLTTDAPDLELYFRYRYAPQSYRSLISQYAAHGFGHLVCDGHHLKPEVSPNSWQIKSFLKWWLRFRNKTSFQNMSREVIAAEVLNRQLFILSSKKRSA